MSVEEILMRPGSGEVALTPDAPLSLTQAIYNLVVGAGCHIVITPTPIDPATVSDASMLSSAMYTGRVIDRPGRTSIGFVGMSTWLDSYTETVFSRTAGTPTQWLGDVLLNNITAGTVSGGSNVTRTFPALAQTRRQILDAVATEGGWEYEFRPNFTVNVAAPLGGTPTVVITGKDEGPDGTYIGLLGGFADQNVDASNVVTKITALGQGAGSSIVTGSATKTPALKTQNGSTPTIVQVVNAPNATAANASVVASTVNTAADVVVATTVTTTPVTIDAPATVGTGATRGASRGSAASLIEPPVIFTRPGGTPAPGGGTEINVPSSPEVADPGGFGAAAISRIAEQFASSAIGTFGIRDTQGSGGSESQFVRRVVRPGDNVYVYDLESGLFNTAQQIVYRGEVIFPQTKRVLSMTWAIERGYGVYIRSNAATPVWYDLTPYVAWETPGASLQVGDRPAQSLSTVVNRTNPDIEQRVNSGGARTGTYTPTLTGIVIGTGGTPLNTGEWIYNGDAYVGGKGQLTVWGSIKFGTAGQTFPTNPTVSLPSGFNIATTLTSRAWGIWYMFDDNVPTDRIGTIFTNSATTLRLLIGGVTSAVAALTTTTPWTWAASDELIWQCTLPVTVV